MIFIFEGSYPMSGKYRIIPVFFLAAASLALPPGSSPAGCREQETELAGLLPEAGKEGEWRVSSEPRFYEPENLFEYINGAADEYLLYGFRRVVTADYNVGAGPSSVNVEIYLMESPMHAFGIYAAERSPAEKPVEVGVMGYLGANALNFYKGPYYVKITSFDFSKDLSASLIRMGGSVAGKIPGDLKAPDILGYFPEEDKVRFSERFIPTGFLGQSYLNNGYRCDYSDGREDYQVFLVPCVSDSAAKSNLDRYRSFLESQEYKILPGDTDDAVVAEKQNHVLAFAFRSCFGGVLNIGSLEKGRAIVGTVKKNLFE